MGQISEKLVKRLSKKWQLASEIRQAADLIRQALIRLSRLERIHDSQGDMIDPLHGVYTAVQNVTSIFAERVTEYVEFKPYYAPHSSPPAITWFSRRPMSSRTSRRRTGRPI